MNKVWYILIIIGILLGLFTNHLTDMGSTVLEVGTQTFDVFLKMGLQILFWNGIFHIAIKAGLIQAITKIFRKPLSFLFPEVSVKDKTMEYICANLIANLLGIGLASTPMALKALEELQKKNVDKSKPTRSMHTLVLLNIAGFSLFPTSLIGMRKAYRGTVSMKLVLMLLFAMFVFTTIVLVLDFLCHHFLKRKTKCKSSPYTLL